MQIRRLNGGRLAGVKAVLKATPEKIWYRDESGVNHTSVVHILSLEVGGPDLRSLLASMEEPAKLFQQGRSAGGNGGPQYVVREAEAERAQEIAGEFYQNAAAAGSEPVEASIPSNEEDEVIARICELTHRLGYNQAKTKMLLRQWAQNLVSLERSLLNELEALPDESVCVAEDADRRKAYRESKKQAVETGIPNSPRPPLPQGDDSLEGFLF